MRFYSHLTTLLLCLLSIGLALGWPRPPAHFARLVPLAIRTLVKRALAPSFLMNTTGDIKVGGCKDYVKKIDDAYDETVEMAKGKNQTSPYSNRY